jgi:hypothetical protein
LIVSRTSAAASTLSTVTSRVHFAVELGAAVGLEQGDFDLGLAKAATRLGNGIPAHLCLLLWLLSDARRLGRSMSNPGEQARMA